MYSVVSLVFVWYHCDITEKRRQTVVRTAAAVGSFQQVRQVVVPCSGARDEFAVTVAVFLIITIVSK